MTISKFKEENTKFLSEEELKKLTFHELCLYVDALNQGEKDKTKRDSALYILSKKAEDMSRNEAAVFLLNGLGSPCKLENITNQDIRHAFNNLSTKNKQTFVKGMSLHSERVQAAEKAFKNGKFKSIAKLPYYLVNTLIKGGATGFSIGLAINQVFPSLLPVNFGAAISQLPEILAKTNIALPEYFNTLLKTISVLGASAIPQNVYHGAVIIGATVVGATTYTIAKPAIKTMQILCKKARNANKNHTLKKYEKKQIKKTHEVEI